MDWTPFSAPLDRESCSQAAAERQRSICPFEAQQTLKEQHKQIQVQQQGPLHNYWRCNVLLIMIETEEFSFLQLLPVDRVWVISWERQLHYCLYIPNEITTRLDYKRYPHIINVCFFFLHMLIDITQWVSVASLWGCLHFLLQTPRANPFSTRSKPNRTPWICI